MRQWLQLRSYLEFDQSKVFLWLGLPSTLIRHENGAFQKRSSNRRNLKTRAFHLRVEGRHFENEALRYVR